ncbi:MAG: hypothetical protein QNJ22_18470 [Desulfosarcinaceae bacterium]|nr:hypothetical protein [Desulfosarcinaceae bacterium]
MDRNGFHETYGRHELTYGRTDDALRRLFRAAARALQAEDASLAKSFAMAPQAFDRFYADSNHGLGYDLFETTLVYFIFKAWIPLTRVAWEQGYEAPDLKWADLVVYDKDDAPKYVFEAKWWMHETQLKRKQLLKEAVKLLDWAGDHRRFLLTFWYSDYASLEEDLLAVDDFRTDAHKSSNITFTKVFFGAFPTEIQAEQWASRQGYFGMMVLEVASDG